MGLTVKGNTSAGKGKWQSFHVPCDRLPNSHALQYSLPEFPVEFRRLCLRTIYGDKFEIRPSACAGNVGQYSVAMYPHEWEHVMALWPVLSQTESIKCDIETQVAALEEAFAAAVTA